MQMFVNRDEEDKFVASLHFPATHGRARQVKIVAWIREFVRKDAAGVLRVDDERQFDDQALADFAQISVNFITAALPVLRKSAYLLSRLKLERAISNEPEPDHSADSNDADLDDGLKEYIVNVDGWPLTRRRFKLYDVVRLYPGHVTRDVESGYLVRVDDLAPSEIADGTLFGKIIAAYRKSRAEDLAVRRPPPTDTETFLATSDGRKARKEIVKAFKDIADWLFPSKPGAGLARTPAEKSALIAALRADFNRRQAEHILANDKITASETYAEMAEDGRYGTRPGLLTESTIANLIGRNTESGRKRKPKRQKRKTSRK